MSRDRRDGMSDDIEVPVIEIVDGFTVDDIETLDDCDDAFAILTALVASIEYRVDEFKFRDQEFSEECRRAKAALRWKKAALNAVQSKRSRITRKAEEKKQNDVNTRLLDYFRAMHPEEFRRGLNHIKAGTDKVVAT